MLPGSTLFVGVCTQRDYWAGGTWPLVDDGEAREVAALFALATRLGIRQGGVECWHAADIPPALPDHCLAATAGAAAAPGCVPGQPVVAVTGSVYAPLDRAHVYHVRTGCAVAVDGDPTARAVFDHLTAGVRDAVVFGAGVEYGLVHVVDALLRRRVRTHVALDAAAAADDDEAQQVIARWKRRGVDGATTATITRLLTRVN